MDHLAADSELSVARGPVIEAGADWRFPAWAETHAHGWRWRQSLVDGALQAFQAGDWHDALRHLDPCCGMPIPAAEDLLLRSEVFARLGYERLSKRDLDAAYAIDPTLPALQLRMLGRLWRSSGDSNDLVRLARRLVGFETTIPVLKFCLTRVLNDGTWTGVALTRTTRKSITIILMTAEAQNVVVDARFAKARRQVATRTSADHSHAGVLGHASTIELAWPDGEQVAMLSSADLPVWWPRKWQARPWHSHAPAKRSHPSRIGEPTTVVVPIYDGLAATQACLDTVLADDVSRSPHRIVLVDDRGPDPRLTSLMAQTVARGRALGREIHLLRNPANLGFIGSINNAMAAFPSGPMVLLNADTLVPKGWLDRLLAAGGKASVGTVTALSNNGEVMSMPDMFVAAPMPSADVVDHIDALVARENRGRIVDVPNGVGFCMLITQAAREACGFLNDVDYQQGYLEEVDYCLRAAEHGLRNVCACDVFVGHEGGKSFRDNKRALVVRNLGELERRFPSIRRDTLRFQNEDPLADVRQAFQLSLLRDGIGASSVTLEIGQAQLMRHNDLNLGSDGESVVTITPSIGETGDLTLRLESADLLAPSRLDLTFTREQDAAAEISRLFSAFQVSSILFTDSTAATQRLFALPSIFGAPFDLRLTHDDFAGEALQNEHFLEARTVTTISPRLMREGRLLGRDDIRLERHRATGLRRLAAGKMPATETMAVAVFCDESDHEAAALVLDLARSIKARRMELPLVLFGRSASRSMLVTGGVIEGCALADEHATDLMLLHHCRASLSLIRTDAYEHPVQDLFVNAPRPLLSFSGTLTEPLDFAADDVTVVDPDLSSTDLLDVILEKAPILAQPVL